MERKAPYGPIFVTSGLTKGLQKALSIPGVRRYPESVMSIRILIIDEHLAAREMLARRLKSLPDFEVLGTTGSISEGLRQMKDLLPDMVLLDTKMSGTDGIGACRCLCSAAGKCKVAVLTSYVDAEERRLVYRAGACGYLLKEADTPRLAEQIKAAVGA